MKKHSVIALITDFGTSDGYIGSVKGAILSLSPSAQIIDISHSVSPQNIDEGAFLLWSVFQYFPKGTIFVCVVDPGVGGSRKILCVETAHYLFLAPDNGILKFVLNTIKPTSIVAVTNKRYWRKEISRTFHGRDIFAPVAAHLSRGGEVSRLGLITDPLFGKEDFVDISSKRKKIFAGKVIHIDHFGNIITNFHLRQRPKFPITLRIGKTIITRFSETYGEAEANRVFSTQGSSNLIEISIKNRSAAEALQVKLNQQVRLWIK